MTKAMLEGNPYNVCFLAFINMGINIDRLIEELDRINDSRGKLTQHDQSDPMNKPAVQ